MRLAIANLLTRISIDDTFVERCLLALYRRHIAKDKLNPAHKGHGFSYRTQKTGMKLGRWLDKNPHFTDGTGRWSNGRAEHLKAAREVLTFHINQVEEMIEEVKNVRAIANVAPKQPEVRAAIRPAVQTPKVQTVGTQTVIRREVTITPEARKAAEADALREQLRLNLEMGKVIMQQLQALSAEADMAAEGPTTERRPDGLRPSQVPASTFMGMTL